MVKNKNSKKFGPKGHARSIKKGSKNKIIKFQNSKNTKNVLKFIASSMPFTIWYLNEPFMS